VTIEQREKLLESVRSQDVADELGRIADELSMICESEVNDDDIHHRALVGRAISADMA